MFSMIPVVIRTILALCVGWAPGLVLADNAQLLRAQISASRGAMVNLLADREQRTPERLAAALELVASVDLLLSTWRVPPDRQAALVELQALWRAYRITLEVGVLPALRSGLEKDATRLVAGLQRERTARALKLWHQIALDK